MGKTFADDPAKVERNRFPKKVCEKTVLIVRVVVAMGGVRQQENALWQHRE